MQTDVKAGAYVVAVSGGVDSMVLLDLLVKQLPVHSSQLPAATRNGEQGIGNAGKWQLIVAHFDHGIRPDSTEDRKLVQSVAERYNLPFEYAEGKLGAGASEEVARAARYAFLEQVRAKYGAGAIITAHHQDDVLETAILNIMRGTGRAGLSSLASRPGILRPLLSFSKQDIRSYAETHHVSWREDSTNADERYMRNYVRHRIVPQLSGEARQGLLKIIDNAQTTNRQLDRLLVQVIDAHAPSGELDKAYFARLPHDVAKELLASWLRAHGIRDFTSQTLERVTVAAKTQQPGSTIDVMHHATIRVSKSSLALVGLER